METEEKNKSWGGKREGAGRKKAKAGYCGFRMTPETEIILSSKDNKTDFINKAVVFYEKYLAENNSL